MNYSDAFNYLREPPSINRQRIMMVLCGPDLIIKRNGDTASITPRTEEGREWCVEQFSERGSEYIVPYRSVAFYCSRLNLAALSFARK